MHGEGVTCELVASGPPFTATISAWTNSTPSQGPATVLLSAPREFMARSMNGPKPVAPPWPFLNLTLKVNSLPMDLADMFGGCKFGQIRYR